MTERVNRNVNFGNNEIGNIILEINQAHPVWNGPSRPPHDPDIVYMWSCTTSLVGEGISLSCDCNVTEPSYTSDDIAPHGYIYEYTVTPKSDVNGASNGTSLTVAGV